LWYKGTIKKERSDHNICKLNKQRHNAKRK
jgi:hypothetical protein